MIYIFLWMSFLDFLEVKDQKEIKEAVEASQAADFNGDWLVSNLLKARKNSFNWWVSKKLTIETHWFTMKLCHNWKYSEQAMAQLSPAMEGQQGWSVQGKCKKQQFYAKEIKKNLTICLKLITNFQFVNFVSKIFSKLNLHYYRTLLATHSQCLLVCSNSVLSNFRLGGMPSPTVEICCS